MNKNGPVIIIEDDPDDQEILKAIFDKLKYTNDLIFFSDGEKALRFLMKTEIVPFIILSDINMPIMTGLELKCKLMLDVHLAIRCVPYLYMSTSISQKMVIAAYSTSAQGFFVKVNSIPEIERAIIAIMEYWALCSSPSNFINAA